MLTLWYAFACLNRAFLNVHTMGSCLLQTCARLTSPNRKCAADRPRLACKQTPAPLPTFAAQLVS